MAASVKGDFVAVMRATSEEQISFSTFSVMLLVNEKPSPPTIVSVSMETGFSYHALRNLVDRSPWLQRLEGPLPRRLNLTNEGREKLAKITRKIAKYSGSLGRRVRA